MEDKGYTEYELQSLKNLYASYCTFMNKSQLILKHFQKKDQLTVKKREYQKTIFSLFQWLVDNDKVTDDKTTKHLPDFNSSARIITKQEGILAGVEELEFLLPKYTHLSFKPIIHDCSQFKQGDTIAQIRGKSHDILAYERTILNILQRMSGIATETNNLINLTKIQDPPFISATRKTSWMSLDKKAVAVGGGLTHRLNLSDGILIKDNHLANISIEKASKTIFNKVKDELIEIEVENEKQAFTTIKIFQNLTAHNPQPTTHNCLAILLDNFSTFQAKDLINNLSSKYDLSQIIFEASGGITGENIARYAQTGADIISLGALTHSTQTANISLEFV